VNLLIEFLVFVAEKLDAFLLEFMIDVFGAELES